MTAQVIHRDRLGVLTKIGQGGQGVVYRAPNVKTTFAASMVFKEYKPQARAEIDFTALASMPALVEDSLSYAQAERMVSIAAWPCALVEDDGASTGFVMPAISDQFFIPLTTVKGVSNTTAEFQHLLNHPSVLEARGINITDNQRYSLLREVASALTFLHKHRVCVGDMSPKNLLFSLTPHEAVYFIDCDAMRINGISALRQLETPGWDAPSGEELATIYTDTYKLGLLALRLLVGDHDTTNPHHLPATTPNMLRQIITDTLKRQPTSRPLPDAWSYVLGHAIEHARHQQKIGAVTTAPASEPPPIPVVHSRPTSRAPRSRPPAATPYPTASPSPSPSPSRNLTVLFAVFTIAVVAIIVGIIVLIALPSEHNSPSTPQTTSDSQPSTDLSSPTPPAPIAPGQITYSVTGTKAPFDQVTITYTDAAGKRRILSNVYIPWTLTVTPITTSDVGSIEATSLLRLSKLNCSITASDGKVLSSSENNQPQVNC
jgi:eukaryotic-like serine/threonine-protein kinase